MEQDKSSKPVLHMFICTRSKDKGQCCGAKGGTELRQELKDWVKNNNLKDKVKITASQCLGHCEAGITVCIYPENKWFLKVKPSDVENLKNEILHTIKE